MKNILILICLILCFSATAQTSWDNVNSILNIANARIVCKAGTAAANTVPLKFTSGTNLTTPEAGAMEYDGTNLYFSPSTTRKRTVLSNNATPSNGQIPIGNGTDYTVANITASDGLVVTNGTGTIAISNPTSTSANATINNAKMTSTNGIKARKVGDMVHIYGQIAFSSTATTAELTLTDLNIPAGFRPAGTLVCVISCTSTTGNLPLNCVIASNGNIGFTSFAGLDPVSFTTSHNIYVDISFNVGATN